MECMNGSAHELNQVLELKKKRSAGEMTMGIPWLSYHHLCDDSKALSDFWGGWFPKVSFYPIIWNLKDISQRNKIIDGVWIPRWAPEASLAQKMVRL